MLFGATRGAQAQALPGNLPGLPPPPAAPVADPGLLPVGPITQPPTAATVPTELPGMNPLSAGQSGATPPAASAPPPAPAATHNFEIVWNNGLVIQTTDKKFVTHWGATVQYDFSWYSVTPILQNDPINPLGRFADGANPRRIRIFSEGTLYQAVDYKFELEFMNGIGFSPAGTTNPIVPASIANSPGPTDAWLNIKDVPILGNIRVGNQKEWFSLEHLNNYRALEFLERSYLFDFAQATAFNNGFTPGISTFRTWADDRVFTAVGVYKNESDLIGFGIGDGQYAVTGRVAALPVWQPDDQFYWHIGGAMSHRDPVDDRVQIRIRENIRNAPFPLLPLIANTGLLDASSQQLFNLETAVVWGPLTFQAEYTANVIRGARVADTATAPAGPPLGTLFFQGYYAEVMWLVTGESRTWNAKQFVFNRVVPLRPFKIKRDPGEPSGWGAWELAARYTYLDLSNGGLQAGRLDSVTLGVNWYLNTSAKFQLNYNYTHRGDTNNPVQGQIHAVGIRSSYDF